jgi:hypothetical protein
MGKIKNGTETLTATDGAKVHILDADRPRGPPKGNRNRKLGCTRCMIKRKESDPLHTGLQSIEGERKVRTKAPKSSVFTAECLCAGNSAPDGGHGRGRPANKRRTSVNGCRLCAADIDGYSIQGDT